MNKVPLTLLALIGFGAAPFFAQDAAVPPVETTDAAKPAEATSEPATGPTVTTPKADEAAPEVKPKPRRTAPRVTTTTAATTPIPQATPARASRRVSFAERTPRPAPVAGERKLTLFEKIFGRRRTPPPFATPLPTPKPATPRRVIKKRPPSTPAPVDGAVATTDGAPSTPAPVVAKTTTTGPKTNDTPPVEPPVPAPDPVPVKTNIKSGNKKTGRVKPTATPAPIVNKRPLPPPPTSSDPDVQEKYRYEVAKSKAQDDPEVAQLKEKADSAANDDEARKAQRAYNKALFQKMRGIDRTLKERVDRIEAGILKRLEAP